MATAGLGVPVKLLHESLGHVITVELKTGQLYRGKLAEGSFSILTDFPLECALTRLIYVLFRDLTPFRYWQSVVDG